MTLTYMIYLGPGLRGAFQIQGTSIRPVYFIKSPEQRLADKLQKMVALHLLRVVKSRHVTKNR
jgi:hypothetical protein